MSLFFPMTDGPLMIAVGSKTVPLSILISSAWDMIGVSSFIQRFTTMLLTELLVSIVRSETDSIASPVASYANILVITLSRFLRGSQTCLIFLKISLYAKLLSCGK